MRQEDGRGVVVDHQARLCAGQPHQQRRGVIVARAAAAGHQVILQVAVAGGQGRDRGAGLLAEGGAAQIGVNDDAGGVYDRLQAGAQGHLHLLLHLAGQVGQRGAGGALLDGGARLFQHGARCGQRQGVTGLRLQINRQRKQQLVHRRQTAQFFSHRHLLPISSMTAQATAQTPGPRNKYAAGRTPTASQ